MKVNILCVIGTRPEVIKMAPVILALQKESWASVRVLATAQHRNMLDEALSVFGIKPDIDLNAMEPGQKLSSLTARLLLRLDEMLEKESPDVVLAQGDTTTVFTVALACFYRHIDFCHVEAGLRTHNRTNPFPEETNRVLASRLARLHFAPTELARHNLLYEGIRDELITVTGNTVIDALFLTAKKNIKNALTLPKNKKIILLTVHRRENFGQPLINIYNAVRSLVEKYEDIHIVYPVHPNPEVNNVAYRELADLTSITLCDPLNYEQLVTVLKASWIVLTDSGGLQEEAPTLNIPVLVLRQETERPEAVEAGVAKLVGVDQQAIINAVELLRQPKQYLDMVKGISPYGDGMAAQRIVDQLRLKFSLR